MAPGMSKAAVTISTDTRGGFALAGTRTLALHVLFRGAGRDSAAQIRRGFQLLVRGLRYRGLAALLLLLHPRNTKGVLITMTLVAFLVNRYSGIHARAEAAYRRRFWRGMMRSAQTYDEWLHAAKMLEKEDEEGDEEEEEKTVAAGEYGNGALSQMYDEELVRSKLQEFRLRRQQGSVRDIMFSLRADLLRNLGNMCNPQLHKGRVQVPGPIREYIDEVAEQLRLVVEADEAGQYCGIGAGGEDRVTLEEKLAFVHETRHAFGRTALLLSGGATLGAFHVGVMRTLVENGLLPRIICGSSGGSIVCAIASTRSDPELEDFFDHSLGLLKFFDQLGGTLATLRRVVTHGAVHEIRQLQAMLRSVTGNMTFQEAYDLTGRILCVTVCSPRKHERPRCLNYLTSPHVLIWSAVTASCAFPGLFEAQELMAKDRYGNIVPYHNLYSQRQQGNLNGGAALGNQLVSVRRWRDGSLESDLPIEQLKELFNVNHFIVSQANPHIAPILRIKEFIRGYAGNFAAKMAKLAEMEVKHRCNQIMELGIPMGSALAKLFAQEWEGDITIVMPATLAQYWRIIQNPTAMDFQKASVQARCCTWEKLAAIRANCGIEMALDECVGLLNRMRRARRNAQRAASFRGSLHIPRLGAAAATSIRRIPSWNCIARDGYASDDEVSSVSSSLPTTPNARALTPYPYTPRQKGNASANNNNYIRSGAYGGQDDLPETPSGLVGSWTPMGGPLLRASPMATNPVSLPTPTKGHDSHRESDQLRDLRVPPSPNSIVVSEGDFLQTTRTDNGFVFNIVRKDEYLANGCGASIPAKSGHETDGAEEVADYEHGDDGCNSSSSSDCGDDDCPESNCDIQPNNRHLRPGTRQVVATA